MARTTTLSPVTTTLRTVLGWIPSRYTVARWIDAIVRPVCLRLMRADALIRVQSDLDFYTSTHTLRVWIKRPRGKAYQTKLCGVTIRYGTSEHNPGATIAFEHGNLGYVKPNGKNSGAYVVGYVLGAPKGRRLFVGRPGVNRVPYKIPLSHTGWDR